MATQTEVRARITEILTNETDCESAYESLPRGIALADFPAWLVLIKEGDPQSDSEEGIIETRNYSLVLLIQPWAEGGDGEADAAAEPFIDQVRTAFTGRPGLEYPKAQNHLPGVQAILLGRDTGVVNVLFGGASYAGVIWPLQVEQYFQISYLPED
jgi:hypothetical protein